MISDLGLEELAREFWSGTGLDGTFPRNIEKAIAIRLPLALVKMPLLNAGAVGKWLLRRHVAAPLPADPRDLMGCLVAHRGHGVVFVCGHDEPEEQRLTVAHETAHFLVDYLLPRGHVIQALGERITDVLDGVRPPTPSEQAAAILSHVRLGPHIHLLPRMETDEESDAVVAHNEHQADRLALELVAPREHIIRFLRDLSSRETVNAEDAGSALGSYFGVSVHAFDSITREVRPHRPVSFLEDAITTLRGKR